MNDLHRITGFGLSVSLLRHTAPCRSESARIASMNRHLVTKKIHKNKTGHGDENRTNIKYTYMCIYSCLASNCSGSSINIFNSFRQPPPHMARDFEKTNALRRSLPHMTMSAMAALVKYAKEHDISDIPHDRRGLSKSRDVSLEDTPFGPMLIRSPLRGKPPHADTAMILTNPGSYLYSAYRKGGSFFKHINACQSENPSTADKPWRLVLYTDEVVPGNQLAVANSRKVWVAYFSFLELGQLGDEDVWCPMAAEPSKGLKKVNAGISQVFRVLIKAFFGLSTYDMRGGIQLEGPNGERLRIFATLSMLIQDGGAQKAVWMCKGDAGTKLCMLCHNLVTRKSGLAVPGGLLVDDMISDDRLKLATNASIRTCIARLEHSKAADTKTLFKEKEQAYGFTLNEDGLLSDADLADIVAPADQFCHDWMHGLFANGVFNLILFLLLQHVQTLRANIWTALNDYIEGWTWPHSIASKASMRDLFSQDKVTAYKKAKHVKMSASDALSLLPVVVFYVVQVVKRLPGVCGYACNALIALGDLVDALLASKRGIIPPAYLSRCVHTLLESCRNAGWIDLLVPKFHWLLHFAAHLARWGVLPTCWVHERKHKLAKRYGEDTHNTLNYSKSVLSEVLSHQLYLVNLPDAFDDSMRVLNPSTPKQALVDALVSAGVPEGASIKIGSTARLCTGVKCHKADIALFRTNDGEDFIVGSILMFAVVEDATESIDCVLFNRWDIASHNPESGSALCQVRDNPELAELESVLTPVIHNALSAVTVRILIPFEYQGFNAVLG